MNANGDRINFPGYNWITTEVKSDGSAEHCESECTLDAACISYMTEDGTKCDLILSTDTNANGGIINVDSETRNYCWKKTSGKLLLQNFLYKIERY